MYNRNLVGNVALVGNKNCLPGRQFLFLSRLLLIDES